MARSREVRLRLNRPQLVTHSSLFDENGQVLRGRTAFTGWGRGVGKTHYARSVWWLLVALYDYKLRTEAPEPFKGVRINSLCPTLKQWKDINAAGIEAELAPTGKWGFLGGKYDRQSGQVTFPGGSYVKPFPATEYNSRTARGMRADVLDAEELDDIDANAYDAVAIPWLSEPWSLGIELLRGTPTRGRFGLWYRTLSICKIAERLRSGELTHEAALALPQAVAILEVFENLPDDEWPQSLPRDPRAATLFVLSGYYGSHATYRDAPETVSPLAVARAKATTPEATFKREWLADPDAGEGLIYAFQSEPDPAGFCHVRPPPPLEAFREFIVGADHGWVDPACLLLGGIQDHGNDATLWLLDEHYDSEIPNHVWDARAKLWKYAKFWPDPSRPDRINDFRSQGCDCGETDNDIAAGLARVADLLFVRSRETMGPAFQPIVSRIARLYVSPKCKNLIREFGLYRRKKNPDGSFAEEPEDKNNHAMDALRYMAMGRFGRVPNVRQQTAR